MELKIKCPCGVKYALDVSAENVAKPIQFVCQYCGVDSSAAVNEIIRQQFKVSVLAPTERSPRVATASTSAEAVPRGIPLPQTAETARPASASTPQPVETAHAPAAIPGPPRPAVAKPAVAKLRVQAHKESVPEASEAGETPVGKPCLKHPGNFASEECLVCHKPICPKCMELFGYVCSAYCQSQAEKLKIDVPVFAGQKALVERRYWRKVRWVAAAAVVMVLALLGAYAWYYFVGARPRVLYTMRFPSSDRGSFVKLMGEDQLLLRQGKLLSRYDLRTDKALWSASLVDKDAVAKAAEQEVKEQKARMVAWKIRRAQLKAAGKLDEDDLDIPDKPVSDDELLRDATRSVENRILYQTKLRVSGSNIWVITPAKAALYGWDSGKVEKDVSLPGAANRLIFGPEESVLLASQSPKGEVLSRLDLVSGEIKTEEAAPLAEAAPPAKGKAAPKAPVVATAAVAARSKQIKAGAMRNVSSNAIAQAVAVRSASARITPMDMDDDGPGESSFDAMIDPDLSVAGGSFVFAGENVARVEVKLIEKKLVQYQAIKKPKVSELDKGVNAANAVAAMSEVMNEIQVELGGGMRTEDESRYRVTIKRLLAPGIAEWSGEVVGPPALYSLKTVDVLTAGKAMYAFDKSNKKLWESKLAYAVSPQFLRDSSWLEDGASRSPCVEREGTLYFFDQGVLTAFEIASGNPRWRLTTVGISAIHFDDKGTLYVSTSSAGAESLKYSQQIDLSKRIESVIMKVDPQTGKILWKVQKTGSDIYLSGKFLYTTEDVRAGGMRIYRLNPRNGEPIWEHYISRYSDKVEFRQNTIGLVYEDRVQVLRFIAL